MRLLLALLISYSLSNSTIITDTTTIAVIDGLRGTLGFKKTIPNENRVQIKVVQDSLIVDAFESSMEGNRTRKYLYDNKSATFKLITDTSVKLSRGDGSFYIKKKINKDTLLIGSYENKRIWVKTSTNDTIKTNTQSSIQRLVVDDSLVYVLLSSYIHSLKGGSRTTVRDIYLYDPYKKESKWYFNPNQYGSIDLGDNPVYLSVLQKHIAIFANETVFLFKKENRKLLWKAEVKDIKPWAAEYLEHNKSILIKGYLGFSSLDLFTGNRKWIYNAPQSGAVVYKGNIVFIERSENRIKQPKENSQYFKQQIFKLVRNQNNGFEIQCVEKATIPIGKAPCNELSCLNGNDNGIEVIFINNQHQWATDITKPINMDNYVYLWPYPMSQTIQVKNNGNIVKSFDTREIYQTHCLGKK